MYHQEEGEEEGGLEPEWVTAEKEQFTKFRDADNDGYMDLDEVSALIDFNRCRLSKRNSCIGRFLPLNQLIVSTCGGQKLRNLLADSTVLT